MRGYIQALEDFTLPKWSGRFASDITPGDVEDLFKGMTKIGYSTCRQYNTKVAISRCFRFGIMRRLVPGVTVPPTWGLGVSRKSSKRPEILNIAQIVTFITQAYERAHKWRQVWKGAYHSGGRSGELFQLKRKHLDLVERMIHFQEKRNFSAKRVEGLKDQEWRDVPINDDLYDLFLELGVLNMAPEDYVFPRIQEWKNSKGAEVTRAFCEAINVPSICFHTLRACWATQLLKNKVPDIVVMAMGGWSDPETMYRYIRLAGIEIEGGTDCLSFKNAVVPRERPARVLKLMPSVPEIEPKRDDLMERLLSSDPKVVKQAQMELEALRQQKRAIV